MLAPVWPYRPHCGNYASLTTFHTLEGEVTPAYRAAIRKEFAEEGLTHWVIDGRIFVRFWPWLDPAAGVTNAELDAARRLLGPNYRGDPPFPDKDCDLMRTLAFGEPLHTPLPFRFEHPR